MPIVSGGGSIEGGNSAFRIKDVNNNTILEQAIASYGGQSYTRVTQNARPAFIAGGTDGTAIAINTALFGSMSYNLLNTVVNVNNCYDTVTNKGRFTAPISGPYLFTFTSYGYNNNYTHTAFAVNGNTALRRGNNTVYRIVGYGYVANYNIDNQMQEVINLVAGDWVEPHAITGTLGYYQPLYTCFAGVYVG